MTERDLYIQSIPQIAEMIVACRGLTAREFHQWKEAVIASTKKEARGFTQKVFKVIESNL